MPNKLDKPAPFDPNLAPEGYIAQLQPRHAGCNGCAFDTEDIRNCGSERRCTPFERPDEKSVIFIPKPPQP